MKSSPLRNWSNNGRSAAKRNNSQLSVTNVSASNGSIRLTNASGVEDAQIVFTSVKAELVDQINILNEMKRMVTWSEQVDTSSKSRLRIAIEALLIDLNEEIFVIAEEKASGFDGNEARLMVSKAREFQHRKKQIIKRVNRLLAEDPVARQVARENKIKLRSRPSESQSNSRSSLERRVKPISLRNRRHETAAQLMSKSHSPTERYISQQNKERVEKYGSMNNNRLVTSQSSSTKRPADYPTFPT